MVENHKKLCMWEKGFRRNLSSKKIKRLHNQDYWDLKNKARKFYEAVKQGKYNHEPNKEHVFTDYGKESAMDHGEMLIEGRVVEDEK